MEKPRDLKSKVEVTGDAFIKKLRAIVQPPRKKGTWLRHLSDKRLAEVYQRLKLKQSSRHIARIAQNEWGVMRGSELTSLERAIITFRNKAIGVLQRRPQSATEKKAIRALMEQGQRKASVDGLATMSWLIEVQRERLIMRVSREADMKLLIKDTDKTVKELRELCDAYLGRQIELGLLDAKTPEINLRVQHYFDGMLKQIASSPGGGTAMVDATNRLLENLEKDAVLMVEGPDGKYKFVGEREDVAEDEGGQEVAAGGTEEHGEGNEEDRTATTQDQVSVGMADSKG